MSSGKPKKFENFSELEKQLNTNKNLEQEADNTRLYKSKDSRIKKELAFATKKNKSKLA